MGSPWQLLLECLRYGAHIRLEDEVVLQALKAVLLVAIDCLGFWPPNCHHDCRGRIIGGYVFWFRDAQLVVFLVVIDGLEFGLPNC